MSARERDQETDDNGMEPKEMENINKKKVKYSSMMAGPDKSKVIVSQQNAASQFLDDVRMSQLASQQSIIG